MTNRLYLTTRIWWTLVWAFEVVLRSISEHKSFPSLKSFLFEKKKWEVAGRMEFGPFMEMKDHHFLNTIV